MIPFACLYLLVHHICKECRIIYNREFYKRKYATDEEYKRKAIERAHEYRNRPESKLKENQRRKERRQNDEEYRLKCNQKHNERRKLKRNANNTTIKKDSL
jgi:hypothetical protein